MITVVDEQAEHSVVGVVDYFSDRRLIHRTEQNSLKHDWTAYTDGTASLVADGTDYKDGTAKQLLVEQTEQPIQT